MNSVKTGVVVVVLLGVLYGVYKVLNVPEKPLTPEEQNAIKLAESLDIERGNELDPNNIQLGAMGSSGSPVAMQPHSPSTQNPANTSQGSGSRAADFSVPSLTGQQDASGSGYRNDYTPTEPAVSSGRPPAVTEPYVVAEENRNNIGVNLPPLNDTPQVYNKAGTDASFYAEKADQTHPIAPTRNDQDIAARNFKGAMFKAEDLIARGNYRDALAELTTFYDAPSLSPEEQQQLINWLDPLAGKVIYSSEHELESPRIVRSGETLADIAYEHGVPEQLLNNINRAKINNPHVLRPGTELKVVRGPFEAHVSLSKGKLTLFLGELYAGHFPISLGRDPSPQPGTYYVKQILKGREYVAVDGRSISADSPENPYGRWWIDLGSEISIHGSAANDNADGRGCISLSPVDIGDLAEILSQDSRIRIER